MKKRFIQVVEWHSRTDDEIIDTDIFGILPIKNPFVNLFFSWILCFIFFVLIIPLALIFLPFIAKREKYFIEEKGEKKNE